MERVVTIAIRRATPEDYPAFARIFLDKSVYSNTLQLPMTTQHLWQKRLAEAPSHVYILVAEKDGEVVGNLGLTLAINERRRHVAEFGMAVCEAAQGQGVGSALMGAMIDLADNWLNLHRLELTVYTDNAPAIALYRKFGFVIEGESVDYAFRNGNYVNVYHMARIKPV